MCMCDGHEQAAQGLQQHQLFRQFSIQSHDLPVMVLCSALAISGATQTACIAARFCLPPESAICCKLGAAAEVVHCLLTSSFNSTLLTQIINCLVKPRMLLCNRSDLACYHAMWALRQTCSSVPVFNTVAAHCTCFLQVAGHAIALVTPLAESSNKPSKCCCADIWLIRKS